MHKADASQLLLLRTHPGENVQSRRQSTPTTTYTPRGKCAKQTPVNSYYYVHTQGEMCKADASQLLLLRTHPGENVQSRRQSTPTTTYTPRGKCTKQKPVNSYYYVHTQGKMCKADASQLLLRTHPGGNVQSRRQSTPTTQTPRGKCAKQTPVNSYYYVHTQGEMCKADASQLLLLRTHPGGNVQSRRQSTPTTTYTPRGKCAKQMLVNSYYYAHPGENVQSRRQSTPTTTYTPRGKCAKQTPVNSYYYVHTQGEMCKADASQLLLLRTHPGGNVQSRC